MSGPDGRHAGAVVCTDTIDIITELYVTALERTLREFSPVDLVDDSRFRYKHPKIKMAGPR